MEGRSHLFPPLSRARRALWAESPLPSSCLYSAGSCTVLYLTDNKTRSIQSLLVRSRVVIENCLWRALCLWGVVVGAVLSCRDGLVDALQMGCGANAPFVVLQSPVSKALKGHCVHRQCLLCSR